MTRNVRAELEKKGLRMRGAPRRGTIAKGAVICPHCSAGRTKKLRQKNNQFQRECNSCHERFWSHK